MTRPSPFPRIVFEGRRTYWEVAPRTFQATANRDTPPKGVSGYSDLAALMRLKGEPPA